MVETADVVGAIMDNVGESKSSGELKDLMTAKAGGGQVAGPAPVLQNSFETPIFNTPVWTYSTKETGFQPAMRNYEEYSFPTPPFPLRVFLTLRLDDGEGPADNSTNDLMAVSRWRAFLDLWEGRVNAPSGFRLVDPFAAWQQFWRHTGGRMAAGDSALINSIYLDSRYIRCCLLYTSPSPRDA